MAYALQSTCESEDVALIGNGVVWKIEGNQMYSNEGSKGQILIQWNAQAAADETFTLNWGSHSIIFTAKATPDNSGTQFKSTSGDPMATWILETIEYLQKNYYLLKDFEIEVGPSSEIIAFTTREKGDEYTLLYSDETVNITEFSQVDGADKTMEDFYEYVVMIYMLIGANYVKIGEDSAVPDSDQIAYFDIADWFNQYLISSFTYPDGNDMIIERAEMTQKYKLLFCERYGNPPEAKEVWGAALSPKDVAVGGISKDARGILNDNGNKFTDEWSEKFLTWFPRGTKTISPYSVSPYMINKLYFLAQVEYVDAKLVSKAKTHAGFDTAWETVEQQTLNATQIVECITSWNKVFDKAGFAGVYTDYKEYQVKFVDSGGVYLTETFEYSIDYKNYENERVFLFRNSLGVYESLRTLGQQQDNLEYDRMYVNNILDYDYGADNRKKKTIDVVEREVFKANSGWIKKEWLNAWRDFLRSDDVYIDLAQFERFEIKKLTPIIVTSTKVFRSKDFEYQYYIEFEYVMDEDSYYSNALEL